MQQTIRTPSWLERLPPWHRDEDLDQHPHEIASKLVRQQQQQLHAHSAPRRGIVQSFDWAQEFGNLIGTTVQLKKLTTPSHNKACLLPYTSTSVSSQAQAKLSAQVSLGICRMSPQKEQFANVLRTANASAKARAKALVSSLNAARCKVHKKSSTVA